MARPGQAAPARVNAELELLDPAARLPITLVHRRDRFRALETSVKEACELEERGAVRICSPAEVRAVRGDGARQGPGEPGP